jgi:hypothetical protein
MVVGSHIFDLLLLRLVHSDSGVATLAFGLAISFGRPTLGVRVS